MFLDTSKFKASALPGAIAFSVLSLITGMLMIMLFSFSLERIRYIEEKENAMAAFHGFGLKIMTDTSIVLHDDFAEYNIFNNTGKKVQARVTMHGLYGLMEMKYELSSKMMERRVKIIGTRELPLTQGLVVPSDGGGYMTIGKDCCFESPIMLPDGIYRETMSTTYRQRQYKPQVSSSPLFFPELSTDAMVAAKEIFDEINDDIIILDSKDTIPDMLVSARVIKVDSSFCNSVQLFASDSVVIASGARLNYPSGVFLNSADGHVMLEDQCSVEGYMVVANMNNNNKPSGKHLSFRMDSSAVIRGLLYVDGTAQMKGHITGSAYVRTPMEITDKGISRMTVLQLTQTTNHGYAYPLLFRRNQCKKIIKNYEPSP